MGTRRESGSRFPPPAPKSARFVLWIWVRKEKSLLNLILLRKGFWKKSTKIKFWGSETAGWGGSSTRRGGRRKVPALPRNCVFPWVSKGWNLGCAGNFARMSRTLRVFKKFLHTKVCAHFSTATLLTFSSLLSEDFWPLFLSERSVFECPPTDVL